MVSHTRSFSSLGNYQQAHQLIYTMETMPDGQHLSLSKQNEVSIFTETLVVAISAQEAEHAVQYLYENAIPLEHWKDVLEDILPAGCICT